MIAFESLSNYKVIEGIIQDKSFSSNITYIPNDNMEFNEVLLNIKKELDLLGLKLRIFLRDMYGDRNPDKSRFPILIVENKKGNFIELDKLTTKVTIDDPGRIKIIYKNVDKFYDTNEVENIFIEDKISEFLSIDDFKNTLEESEQVKESVEESPVEESLVEEIPSNDFKDEQKNIFEKAEPLFEDKQEDEIQQIEKEDEVVKDKSEEDIEKDLIIKMVNDMKTYLTDIIICKKPLDELIDKVNNIRKLLSNKEVIRNVNNKHNFIVFINDTTRRLNETFMDIESIINEIDRVLISEDSEYKDTEEVKSTNSIYAEEMDRKFEEQKRQEEERRKQEELKIKQQEEQKRREEEIRKQEEELKIKQQQEEEIRKQEEERRKQEEEKKINLEWESKQQEQEQVQKQEQVDSTLLLSLEEIYSRMKHPIPDFDPKMTQLDKLKRLPKNVDINEDLRKLYKELGNEEIEVPKVYVLENSMYGDITQDQFNKYWFELSDLTSFSEDYLIQFSNIIQAMYNTNEVGRKRDIEAIRSIYTISIKNPAILYWASFLKVEKLESGLYEGLPYHIYLPFLVIRLFFNSTYRSSFNYLKTLISELCSDKVDSFSSFEQESNYDDDNDGDDDEIIGYDLTKASLNNGRRFLVKCLVNGMLDKNQLPTISLLQFFKTMINENFVEVEVDFMDRIKISKCKASYRNAKIELMTLLDEPLQINALALYYDKLRSKEEFEIKIDMRDIPDDYNKLVEYVYGSDSFDKTIRLGSQELSIGSVIMDKVTKIPIYMLCKVLDENVPFDRKELLLPVASPAYKDIDKFYTFKDINVDVKSYKTKNGELYTLSMSLFKLCIQKKLKAMLIDVDYSKLNTLSEDLISVLTHSIRTLYPVRELMDNDYITTGFKADYAIRKANNNKN